MFWPPSFATLRKVAEGSNNVSKRGTTWLKRYKTSSGHFNFGHIQNSLAFPLNVSQRGSSVVPRTTTWQQRGTTWLQRSMNVTEREQNPCTTLCCVSATLWYVTIRCATLCMAAARHNVQQRGGSEA